MLEIVSTTKIGNVTDYVIITQDSDTTIETPIKNFTINSETTYFNVETATTELINALSNDTYSDTRLTTEIMLSDKENNVNTDMTINLTATRYVSTTETFTVFNRYFLYGSSIFRDMDGGYFDIPPEYSNTLLLSVTTTTNPSYKLCINGYFIADFEDDFTIDNVYFYFSLKGTLYKTKLNIKLEKR